MFNDKKPSKYLIAKNYEEALAKINTLQLDKNQLNVVYYQNGNRIDALLGIPGYKKNAENIVFNSALTTTINIADIESQVKEIIRKNASSSTTYASEINRALKAHLLDTSTKFEDIDTSLVTLEENFNEAFEQTKTYWNTRYNETVEVFKSDINFTNSSNYKNSIEIEKTNNAVNRLYVLLGLTTDDEATEDSIITLIQNIKHEIADIAEDVSVNAVDISTLKTTLENQHQSIISLQSQLSTLIEILDNDLGDINDNLFSSITRLSGELTVLTEIVNNKITDISTYKENTDTSIINIKNDIYNISTNLFNTSTALYDTSTELSTNIYDISTKLLNASTNLSALDHLIDFTIYDEPEETNDEPENNTEDNNENVNNTFIEP